MLFDFLRKGSLFFPQLEKGFPTELFSDVKAVCNALSVKSIAYSWALYSNEKSRWGLLSGEKIAIPYRIYVTDKLILPDQLTERQQMIYHCIFSRSYDGYVRQKHIEALLDSDPPEWVLPYIIKICDEYIKEILEAVYLRLKDKNCEKYKALCQLNFDTFKRGHSRMISYWNEFYRYECYRYNDYIGKKLYRECFGYNKTGQKTIIF